MRIRALSTISLLLASGVLLYPSKAYAQAPDAQTSDTNAVSPEAESAAAQMVPAAAVLDKALDAKKAQAGQEFRATLTSTIHLKNGVELARGTALIGTIATDSAQGAEGLTFALRFTQAQGKDGKAVPIQVTIMGLTPPESLDSWDQSAGGAPPDPWNGKALQVDQVGVLSGVDLHSRIAGENSGVFVTTKKDDVKFEARSQLSLAIGPQAGGGTNGGF
jgi:hypothetical protein